MRARRGSSRNGGCRLRARRWLAWDDIVNHRTNGRLRPFGLPRRLQEGLVWQPLGRISGRFRRPARRRTIKSPWLKGRSSFAQNGDACGGENALVLKEPSRAYGESLRANLGSRRHSKQPRVVVSPVALIEATRFDLRTSSRLGNFKKQRVAPARAFAGHTSRAAGRRRGAARCRHDGAGVEVDAERKSRMDRDNGIWVDALPRARTHRGGYERRRYSAIARLLECSAPP